MKSRFVLPKGRREEGHGEMDAYIGCEQDPLTDAMRTHRAAICCDHVV